MSTRRRRAVPIRATGPTWSITALASEAGVTERRIRKWIEKGALMPAIGRGVNAYYTAEHLERIRLILTILDDNMTLADIRDRFAPLDHDEEALVDEMERILP